MNDDKTLFRAYVNNDDLQYSHYIYKTDLFNSNTIKLSMVLRGYNFLVSNCKNINNSDCYIITAVLSVDNDDHTHQYRNFFNYNQNQIESQNETLEIYNLYNDNYYKLVTPYMYYIGENMYCYILGYFDSYGWGNWYFYIKEFDNDVSEPIKTYSYQFSEISYIDGTEGFVTMTKLKDNLFFFFGNSTQKLSSNLLTWDEQMNFHEIKGDALDNHGALAVVDCCISEANDYQTDPVTIVIVGNDDGRPGVWIKYFPNGLYDSNYNLKSCQDNPSEYNVIRETFATISASFCYINKNATKILIGRTDQATGQFKLMSYFQKKIDNNWVQVTDNQILGIDNVLNNLFKKASGTGNVWNTNPLAPNSDISHTFTYILNNTLYSYDLVWND